MEPETSTRASGRPVAKRENEPNGPVSRRLDVLRIGAGEGIRTLDPNLGKVMLYP